MGNNPLKKGQTVPYGMIEKIWNPPRKSEQDLDKIITLYNTIYYNMIIRLLAGRFKVRGVTRRTRRTSLARHRLVRSISAYAAPAKFESDCAKSLERARRPYWVYPNTYLSVRFRVWNNFLSFFVSRILIDRRRRRRRDFTNACGVNYYSRTGVDPRYTYMYTRCDQKKKRTFLNVFGLERSIVSFIFFFNWR